MLDVSDQSLNRSPRIQQRLGEAGAFLHPGDADGRFELPTIAP